MTRYCDWIVDRALPLWASRGFDAGAGRFRERLTLSGEPIDVPHRAMVQARQIYVFAHAAELGWFPQGGPLAEVAMASLRRDFCAEASDQASFAFSIHPAGGRVASPVRDAYAHAFVLFSIAALYRLNGDHRLLDLADRIVNFIDMDLADRTHGGLHDCVPAASGSKRQNPHMHLLEAYIFLEKAAPGHGYIERAADLVALFERCLFKADRQVLLEHFSPDWSAHPDPARTTTVEPGHHFEWVWLLGEYTRLTGIATAHWTGPLFDMARRHGLSDTGLIFDELAAADRSVLKNAHRLWPHTEAIKAAATRHADGDAGAAAMAGDMTAILFDRFLDRPFPGGWIDHIDAGGAPLVDHVPASSLYHLFLAATVAQTIHG